MAVVTGFIGTFGSTMAYIPGVRLLFIPPTFGQTGNYLLTTAPIPAEIDPLGAFTVTLAPTTTIRPTRDDQGRPWGYGIRAEWLNGAGIPTGFDFPDIRVYVPPGGGPIETMTSTPILPTQLWITPDGAEPAGSKRGDLIWNTTTQDIRIVL